MDPWIVHMRRGDYAAAWSVSDAVLARRAGQPCGHRPRHEQWIWNGTPLAGKRVLVRCYHGLGDTIQFVRYAPALTALARATTWWVQPELIPLLRSVRGIGRLFPLHDGVPDLVYDVDIESMELAHAFRSTRRTLPPAPYLDVEPRPLEKIPGTLDVGLVARAGAWDSRRTIPETALAPLTQLPDVRWHALREPTIRGTARLMRALDLVVTVDSMPAHLAGALGLPVWTLLHHAADWRWMEEGETTPWYPTMRLFRQPEAGNWPAVIERVTAELAARTPREAHV
jgi:hypothetical protein